MFEELISSFIIQNISTPDWFFPLIIAIQVVSLVSFTLFLALLIWSIVLFTRAKKFDPSSRRFLLRLLGFSFALVLSALCFTFTIVNI